MNHSQRSFHVKDMEKVVVLGRTHMLLDAATAPLDVRTPQHQKKETGAT